MTSADDTVQLDEYDVPSAVLVAKGMPLVDLIGGFGAASVPDLMGTSPPDGWRVIAGDLALPGAETPILAAPWVSRGPDTWMLISVMRERGGWSATLRGDVITRPGRVIRRAGLELRWAISPMSSPAGAVPELKLRLHNARDGSWRADWLDSDGVRAWALGPSGERLMVDQSAWRMIAMRVRELPSMESGADLELTATWQPRSVERLPAGEYALDAQLLSLQMDCSPGILRIY